MILFGNRPNIPEPYHSLVKALAAERPNYDDATQRGQVRKQILALPPNEQRDFVRAALTWIKHKPKFGQTYARWWFYETLVKVLRRKLPFEHDDLLLLLDWTIKNDQYMYYSTAPVIKALQRYLHDHDLTPTLQEKIKQLIKQLDTPYTTVAERRWLTTLNELAGVTTHTLPVIPGEAWSDAAIQDIAGLDHRQQTAWQALLQTCARASSGSPSDKWMKTAVAQRDAIGVSVFNQALLRWLPLVDKPRTTPVVRQHAWEPDHNYVLNESNVDVLRGLVWLCSQSEDKQIARALTALAITMYRSMPGVGQRSVRLGNACVWALGAMPGPEGIAQLALLRVKVKFGSAQRGIEKALAAAAERAGMTPADLEELTVPTYGLQATGVRHEQVGAFTAELVVTGTNTTELRWITADGKRQSSVPKVIKHQHIDTLKELIDASKDIRKMLPVQRDRIERLYLERKSWDLATWRERYLDHPLVGTLARRLLWQFRRGEQTGAGIWHNGQIVGRNGSPLAWLDDTTDVELWHPLHTTPEVVLAWRAWLHEREIQQPFKQAYREIYVLTDAERNTNVYSNRFAAHILKQHQFNALCGARGWRNKLRLQVDDYFPPATRLLPAWGLRAEFWVDGIGEEINDIGTFLYLSTDQVRFYPIHAHQHAAHAGSSDYEIDTHDGVPADPIVLENVPPLVFSEIMRDVDLFVGVASVGNDPTWSDGGTAQRYREYWNDYSFGILSETAKTRRQVLEQIVPRLKIADRCQITDRFLRVRGDLRTYKIHLGSGNILMEPNDQYLCIVPSGGSGGEGARDKLFLPFEGDRTLAIILSKAMLLAYDTRITDPTIVHQLQR